MISLSQHLTMLSHAECVVFLQLHSGIKIKVPMQSAGQMLEALQCSSIRAQHPFLSALTFCSLLFGVQQHLQNAWEELAVALLIAHDQLLHD